MDTQPSNSTEFPPSDQLIEDPEDLPSSSTPQDASSPPPPSSPTGPPDPLDEPPPDNEPSPPNSPETTPSASSSNFQKTPPTPSQKPPANLSPSPPSQEPDNSPPNPLIISPTYLSGDSLVQPGPPAHTSSNNVSGYSESTEGAIVTTAVVAIGIVSGLILFGAIGLTVWWFWRAKKKVGFERETADSSPQSGSGSLKMRSSPAYSSSEYGHESESETSRMGSSRNNYSYKELAKATNDFSESNLLGEGGFGYVFKGLLPNGREVAVKRLKNGGGQGEREFRAEVETISHIHHRHLVLLVGYCISDDKRLLVYDFVPNNTLHFHLHGILVSHSSGQSSQKILSWTL